MYSRFYYKITICRIIRIRRHLHVQTSHKDKRIHHKSCTRVPGGVAKQVIAVAYIVTPLRDSRHTQ